MRALTLCLMLSGCAQEPKGECIDFEWRDVERTKMAGTVSVTYTERYLACIRRVEL